MIAAIYGADALSVRRHLDALKARVGSTREELESNVSVFEARDLKPNDVLAAAMVPPFLAAARLVVLEGVLDRFEGSGTGRGARSLGPLDPLFAAASALPPTTMLVFTGGAPQQSRRANPVVERLKQIPGAEVVEYPELKGQALHRFIREEATSRGIRFRVGASAASFADGEEWRRPAENDPVRLLADLHPADTLSLANELDKLALYTRGREATVDDVALVCAGERTHSVFEMTDAAMDGNFQAALGAFHALIAGSESHQGVIALIVGAYRRMATLIDLMERGASDAELAAASPVGRFQSLFAAAKGRAQRHGRAGLLAAYDAIVTTDRRIKLGELKDDVALELLLANLSLVAPQRASAPRQRPRAS